METPGPDQTEPTPPIEPGDGSTVPPAPPVTPVPRAAPGAPTPAPSAAGPGPSHGGAEQLFEGGLDGEWPARAADAIVNVVGSVRDRTTGPITTVARGVVFGLLAAVLGLAVGVLVVIAAIRLLDQVLPSGVWVAYLVLGGVFLLAGALVFRKRNQPAPAGNTSRP
jgi:hypothetical protein